MHLAIHVPKQTIACYNHYWNWAFGKAPIALGESFAECNTRQRPLGKKILSKAVFAECFLSGTPQSSNRKNLKKLGFFLNLGRPPPACLH
jgi:hypothetical protein